MSTRSERYWSIVDTAGAPALDRGPRADVRSANALVRELTPLLGGLPELRRDAAQALAHLWHDDLDAAHALCQAHEGDPDNDYIHALLHRREGDFANAKYWFAEVGAHPSYPAVASAARELGLRELVSASGDWRPAAAVDACRKALADYVHQAELVDVQAREFHALADHLLAE